MIRTVHPLYLLGLMLLLLFTLIWQNKSFEEKIIYEQGERASAEMLAKRIVELKKVMKAPQRGQLDNFIEDSQFSGADINHRVKSGRYIVDAKHMNARQLQSFLNRILNMNLQIVQFKVERKDDKFAGLYMEINL